MQGPHLTMKRPSTKHFLPEIQKRLDAKIYEIEAKIELQIPCRFLRVPRSLFDQEPCCKPLSQSKGINLPTLKPMAHDVLELAQLVSKCAPTSLMQSMSELQIQAYQVHQYHLIENHIFAVDTIAQLSNLMRKYFVLFDDLYFFGTVTKGAILQFRDLSHATRWGKGFEPLGVTRLAARGKGKFWRKKQEVVIEIDLAEHIRKRDRGDDRLTLTLGTLLHEMIHAFLLLYSCSCSAKCIARSCSIEGSSGHGPPWHIAALGIEKSLEDIFGMDVDIGRDEVLRNEILASGGTEWHFWPSSEEFERLQIDVVLFKKDLCENWEWNMAGDRVRVVVPASGVQAPTRNSYGVKPPRSKSTGPKSSISAPLPTTASPPQPSVPPPAIPQPTIPPPTIPPPAIPRPTLPTKSDFEPYQKTIRRPLSYPQCSNESRGISLAQPLSPAQTVEIGRRLKSAEPVTVTWRPSCIKFNYGKDDRSERLISIRNGIEN